MSASSFRLHNRPCVFLRFLGHFVRRTVLKHAHSAEWVGARKNPFLIGNTLFTLDMKQYPALKKPLEHIRKQIQIPGSFWTLASGRMSESEKETIFYVPYASSRFRKKFQARQLLHRLFNCGRWVRLGLAALRKAMLVAKYFGLNIHCHFYSISMPHSLFLLKSKHRWE